jgi:hypothetical protein
VRENLGFAAEMQYPINRRWPTDLNGTSMVPSELRNQVYSLQTDIARYYELALGSLIVRG